MRKPSKVELFGTLVVLVIAFIWSNSLKTGEESGAQSGAVTQFLLSILDPKGRIPEESFHHFVRKAAHFLEFALLGAVTSFLFGAIRQQTGRVFYSMPVLLVLLVAVLDEYIQFFSGRGSAVTDAVLDFCGGLTGLGLLLLAALKKSE